MSGRTICASFTVDDVSAVRYIDGFKRIREKAPIGYEFDYIAQIRADRERDTPEGWKR
ncbi:MAG: hypothetical protein IBX63_00400 [Coriobacteriia bacterium]|nr:hypothetical protein [Coriobacteriia bacterium]